MMKLFVMLSFAIHLVLVTALKPKSPFELDKIETDDFMTLLANKVLVDKTLLLVTGILYPINYGGSLIIHRPEGWGKSTYMSMLDKFFRIEIDERGEPRIPKDTVNNKLFLGGHIEFGPRDRRIFHRLNICHHSFQVKFLGTRAVVFLKLRNITGGSYQEIRDKIRAYIWDLFEEYRYVEYGDGEYYKYWESENYFIGALYILGQKLHNHFTKDVITLIDDYDAPLINAYLEFGDKPDEVEKVRQLLVDIYTAATEKSNTYRNTVIFMGVLDAVVSDFIHFRKEFKAAAYLQDIRTDYALLADEIDELVNRSFNQVDAEDMKNWSCGTFDFFDKPLCQPRASLRYLAQNGKRTNYQSNSSTSRLVNKILSSEDYQDKIQAFIPINASIYHQFYPENRTDNQNHQGLISLYPLDGITILHRSGHLRTRKSSSGKNHFTITTNATRYLFQTKVLQFVSKKFGIDCDKFHSFAELLSSGNLKKFKLALQKYLVNASSYIQQGVREAKLICDGLRIALYHSLSSTHHVTFIKQNVEEKDLGLVNEVFLIPKPGSKNHATSVVIKQKSDLKGTYLNSVTRAPKYKGPLEFLYNDFYHEKNIAMNIYAANDRININVLLQKFTAEMISVLPQFNSTQFFMTFRLSNVTDASKYSSLKD